MGRDNAQENTYTLEQVSQRFIKLLQGVFLYKLEKISREYLWWSQGTQYVWWETLGL